MDTLYTGTPRTHEPPTLKAIRAWVGTFRVTGFGDASEQVTGAVNFLSWLLKENDHLYEHNLDLFKRLSEAESLVEEMTAAQPPLKEKGR